MRRPVLLAILLNAACSSSSPSSSSPVSAVPVQATFTAASLSAPVDVVRDQWGIPHIYGQSFADVAYAQGYLMAQDRWIELDLFRRKADGSLAHILGLGQLPGDIGMRMHHMRATAQKELAREKASSDPQDQTLLAMLNAFTAGVNAWQADLSAGKYTLDPTLQTIYTAASITPWLPEDSLLLGELLTFELAFDDQTDVLRSDLDLTAATVFPGSDPRSKIAQDLENTVPPDPTGIVPGGWGFNLDGSLASLEKPSRLKAAQHPRTPSPTKLDGASKRLALAKLHQLLRDDLHTLAAVGFKSPQAQAHGSNNWVIGPKLSKSGNVMVANDTHLSLQNPPIFYMNHLVVRNGGTTLLDTMGEQFPGAPGVTIGMNQHVAWGATVNFIDVTDIYQLTLHACGGNLCYTFNGADVQLVPRTEFFDWGNGGQIAGSATFQLFDDPNHGPLIPRVVVAADSSVTVPAPSGAALSVKYTGYAGAPLFRAIIGLDLAASAHDSLAAIDSYFRYGGQNWVIGDDQGNYFWTQSIQVPMRNVPPNQMAVVPYKILPGDGTAEWGPDLDPHFIPHAYNHPQGYIATANNDPIGTTLQNNAFYGQPLADAGLHLYLGVDYDPGTRAGRIAKRIAAVSDDGGLLSLDDLSSIQADDITEFGQLLAPTFLDATAALAAALTTPGDGGPQDVSAYALDAGADLQPLFQKVHDSVAAWDFRTPSGIADPDGGTVSAADLASSQAAVAALVWLPTYVHGIFDDELLKLADGGFSGVNDGMLGNATVRLTVQPQLTATPVAPVTGDSILFDDLTTTDRVESKRQIAARSVVRALKFITEQLGNDPTQWKWGQLHTLTLQFAAPIGLNIPSASDPVYPSGFPRHGAPGTVDVGGNTVNPQDFTYDTGPAIRFTCELVPDAGPHGRNVLPGGEIFDPKSPHYADQMELWRKNQTIDWVFQDADVLQAAQAEYAKNHLGRLHFQP